MTDKIDIAKAGADTGQRQKFFKVGGKSGNWILHQGKLTFFRKSGKAGII